MFKQAASISNFPFAFVGTAGDAVTTGTAWGYYSHASGTQAQLGGTVSHLGNGQWICNFISTVETNSTLVGLLFRHATAPPVSFTIPTQTKFVSDLVGSGTAVTVTNTVVVGTNNDKTGYTAIVTSGTVTTVTNSVIAGTVSDKTGYTAIVTSGTVTTVVNSVVAGTVLDKTGYGVTITGAVVVGTNNDKTGYTAIVTSGTVTNVVNSVIAGTVSDKTGYTAIVTSGTVTNLTNPVVVGTNNDKTGYSATISGAVVVGTNNDKTGYTAIVTSGTVTTVVNSVVAGTVSDKTGYTASISSPVVVGTNNDKTGYTAIVTSGTVTNLTNAVVTGTNNDKTGYYLGGTQSFNNTGQTTVYPTSGTTTASLVTVTPMAAIVQSPVYAMTDVDLEQFSAGNISFTCVDSTGTPVNLAGKNIRLVAMDESRRPNLVWAIGSSSISVGGTSSNIVTVTYSTTYTNAPFNGRYRLWNVSDDALLAAGSLDVNPSYKAAT